MTQVVPLSEVTEHRLPQPFPACSSNPSAWRPYPACLMNLRVLTTQHCPAVWRFPEKGGEARPPRVHRATPRVNGELCNEFRPEEEARKWRMGVTAPCPA